MPFNNRSTLSLFLLLLLLFPLAKGPQTQIDTQAKTKDEKSKWSVLPPSLPEIFQLGLRLLCVRFKFWFVFDFVSPSAVKIRQKWLRLCDFDFGIGLGLGLVRVFFFHSCCCKFNTSATQKTHKNVINYKASMISGMGKATEKKRALYGSI